MCIFSGTVERVENTRIFARHSGENTQFLVYSMAYAAPRELAMILPIPVAPRTENPLRFINLKEYPDFFDDLEMGFPKPRSVGISAGGADAARGETLPVVEVGDFVASFVPTIDDFRRLDPRFALPRQTWDQIPDYRDYGFAVFQLRTARNAKQVHPMAFEFATAMPDRLYFPTVHIHDGEVHPREDFDHTLTFQARHATGKPPAPTTASFAEARRFVDIEKAQGIVSGSEICLRMRLHGLLRNRDTLVRVG